MDLRFNILTTFSGRLVILALALVSSIALARSLGPEDRGLFALALLLPELCVIFGRLGIDEANAVYAGLEPTRRRALVWHSVLIAGLIGSLISVGAVGYLCLGAPGLSDALKGPLWLYILPLVLVPCQLLVQYWLAILRGMNRIVLLNLLQVGTKAVSLALILACVVGLSTGVAGAVWVYSAVVFGSLLALAVVLASAGILGRPTFERQLLKRMAGFAFPAYVAGIMTYLNYRIDQILIALFLPLDQLALYVIAVDIAERIWMLPGAVGTALLPHLTHSPQRDPATTIAVARHVSIWTGAACLMLIPLAPVGIEFLFSSEFAGASTPLLWLLPGIFILAIAKVFVSELLAREKIRYTVPLSIAAAGVNAGLNILLLPRMGISGAALASSVSYALVALVVLWYFVRETGVSWHDLIPQKSDGQFYTALFRDVLSHVARGPASAVRSPGRRPETEVSELRI